MRKSKYLLTFLFVALSSLTHSQQPVYFDSVYHFTSWNSWDFSRNVIEVEDGYIIQGETSDQNNTSWHRIGFSKIDTLGTQLWSKSYGDTISGWGLASSGCFIKSLSGGYYAVGVKRTPTGNWVFDQGLIMRLDENLDTLWTKLYGENTEPVDTAYLLQQAKQLENNDLIVVGLAYPYGETSRIYLLKTDSLGNKLWDKWLGFGDTWYFWSFSIIQTSDKGYALGGLVHYYPGGQKLDPIVIKTDSLGNQEWVKYLGGSIRDHQAFVCLSHDKQILAGMNIGHTQYGTTGYSGRICIVKMDNDGNIIWNKEYGGDHYSSSLNSLITNASGNITATGYYLKDFPHSIGWILKTNSEGDSIWLREYDYAALSEYSVNQLFDIKLTNDGGLIACGDVQPHDPDPGNQDAWVIKLDSNGCDTPNCDPTVAIPLLETIESDFIVYPVPVLKDLHIKSALFNKFNHTLTLLNIYGRKVEETIVPQGQTEAIIKMGHLPSGLYILHLTRPNGQRLSRKVLKQ